jgi:hypothetical protein
MRVGKAETAGVRKAMNALALAIRLPAEKKCRQEQGRLRSEIGWLKVCLSKNHLAKP